jgi:DNA-binding MarR family transcriptional regulator
MQKPRRAEIAAVPRPSAAEKRDAIVSPLSDSPGFLLRLAQLRVFDEFHRNFAGLGVTPAGFSVLALIAANPDIRPGTIAEELRVKPSNVAALVNGLVAAGLVQRTADKSELRANCLRVTTKGADAWGEMYQTHLATDERFTAVLSATERDALVALLRKLVDR